MNMQAMLKQAQKLQKDMMNAKDELEKMIFEGKSSFVIVKVNGRKDVLSIDIQTEEIEKDEVEILQDMIVVALKDAFRQVDEETEKKLGKYTQGMPGLF